MSGSEQQLKTSKPVENQLPLKGCFANWIDPKTGRKMLIEGMGSGRFRLTAEKGVKTRK